MNVRELIQRLQKLNQNLEVVLNKECLICKDKYEHYVDEAYESPSYNNTTTTVVVID